MNLEQFRSNDELAAAVADVIARAIERTPEVVLGLPAGRTPILIYRTLVSISRVRHLDWSRVRTFNLDEFVTHGSQSPQVYQRFMHEHLFSLVNVSPANLQYPDGRAADLQAECDRYERAIAAAGGLDLVLLGIGANGHIGFNEPGPALLASTHVVTLQPQSRSSNTHLFDGKIDAVPTQALSMGMATIHHGRRIVLAASGREKSAAIRQMLNGPITTAQPASLLQLHSDVTVMVDAAAAPDNV